MDNMPIDYISDRRLLSRIMRNSSKMIVGKIHPKRLDKNIQRDFLEVRMWKYKHRKMLNIINHEENKLKSNNTITTRMTNEKTNNY